MNKNLNMKPSGVKWIGDIPSDWECKKIKYLATLKGRIGWQGLTSEEYKEEGPYLITGVDFKNGTVDWDSCVHITEERWEEAKNIQIQNGDLLITKDGTVGKVAIVKGLNGKASLNSGVLLIKTDDNYDREYLYWVLQSDVFWSWFNFKNAGNSTIIHLYQKDFYEFKYTIPNIHEQYKIAKFLNKECKMIDEAIKIIEEQVKNLELYKKSYIKETVTKGLDKNVSMKESEIVGIGQIPKHWDIKRLKYICKLKTGATPEGNQGISYDEGINWYTPADFKPSLILKESERYISEDGIKSEKITLYPKDSVLIVGIGATVGKLGIINREAYSNQQITAIIPNDVHGQYLLYYLYSINDFIKDNALYTTLPIINNTYLYNLKCVLPNRDEQKEIVKVISEKCNSIDNIIENKVESINIMKQYKKSLIFEYVTGKKRV